MDVKILGLIAALGIGAAALGGSASRSGRGGGESAARRRLRASDQQAASPAFVPPLDPLATGPDGGLQPIGTRVSGVDERPNPNRARRLAGPLARALSKTSASPIAREDVARFQRAAGVPASGLYDVPTRLAMLRVGVRTAPSAWFLAPVDAAPVDEQLVDDGGTP